MSLEGALKCPELAPGAGDAVDVEATACVQEEEEGGSELAPERQGEADERDLVPEGDHKAQEPPGGQDERDEEEDAAEGPLAPCVGVLAHLGHHEELQAENGSHHGQGAHAAGQGHARSQPRHAGPAQVSEAVWPGLVGAGAEVPQPKQAVLSQEPVAVTDGDRREDHGQGGTHDDEGPDEGFEEGPLGPPLAQQPLGLQDTRGGTSGRGCHIPARLATAMLSAWSPWSPGTWDRPFRRLPPRSPSRPQTTILRNPSPILPLPCFPIKTYEHCQATQQTQRLP